jgi:hypothetical protein
VSNKFGFVYEKVQTELTNVEGGAVILSGERTKVPGLDTVLSELYVLHSLHLCGLFKFMYLLLCESKMLIIRHELFKLLQLTLSPLNLLELLLNLFIINHYLILVTPSIIPPLMPHIMHVIVESDLSLFSIY